jgi:hypothetical protein
VEYCITHFQKIPGHQEKWPWPKHHPLPTKVGILKCILNSLNNPEDDDLDENATLAELAVQEWSQQKKDKNLSNKTEKTTILALMNG